MTKRLLPLLLILGFATGSEAKWWIFGKSPDEVGFRYLRLNQAGFEELDEVLTYYPEMLPEGRFSIRGRAQSGKGKVASVRVSLDDKATWQEAELGAGGVFEFSFFPERGKTYELVVEATDTSGKTSELSDGTKTVRLAKASAREEVQRILDSLVAAYKAQDIAAFMGNVSSSFAGDDVLLERAVRDDFSYLSQTELSLTVDDLTFDPAGRAVVRVTFSRYVTGRRSGRPFSDTGMTEFTFVPGRSGLALGSMRAPLLFGLSDIGNVATGSVKGGNGGNALITISVPSGVATRTLDDIIADLDAEATVESGVITLRETTTAIDTLTFSDGSTDSEGRGTGSISTGDMALAHGFFRLSSGGVVQKLGTGSLSSFSEAPESGYNSNPSTVDPVFGNVFAIRLADGSHALVEVKTFNFLGGVTTYTIQYKYNSGSSRSF